METGFVTTITVDASAAAVFSAVSNVRGWWQGEISGSNEKVGDTFNYRMETFHYSTQQVVELIPGEKIVWLVTDSNLTFTKSKNEWTGTKIIFEITAAGNKTQLRLTHAGLVPDFECYKDCSGGWTSLVQQSLYSLITTGKGVDVF